MNKKSNNMDAMHLVRADIVSRQNAITGKYKAGNFGLEFWDNDHVSESPERVILRANLADELIAKAESTGEDTSKPEVLKRLGQEVNSLMGKSIPRSESIMTSIIVAFKLILYYGVAVGIWGLALQISFLWLGFLGCVMGFVLSLWIAPVVAMQNTKERIKNVVFTVGYFWKTIAFVIGILGLVVWLIRVIF